MSTEIQKQNSHHEENKLARIIDLSSSAWLVETRALELKKDTTPEQVRKLGFPPLSSLIKTENGVVNKRECYLYITGMIILLNEYFGVHWSDGQVEEIAQEFYSEYFYWSLADWKLFSKKCKAQYFVDPSKGMMGFFRPELLMQWAALYNLEWISASLKLNDSSHNEITGYERKMSGEHRRLQAEQDAIHHQEAVKHAMTIYRENQE